MPRTGEGAVEEAAGDPGPPCTVIGCKGFRVGSKIVGFVYPDGVGCRTTPHTRFCPACLDKLARGPLPRGLLEKAWTVDAKAMEFVFNQMTIWLEGK